MVFIVRMDTMPLQGFAQVRDPTRLDAQGGGRSTWQYEILHLYGAGVPSDLRAEFAREYRARSGAYRCATSPRSVNTGAASGSGKGGFKAGQSHCRHICRSRHACSDRERSSGSRYGRTTWRGLRCGNRGRINNWLGEGDRLGIDAPDHCNPYDLRRVGDDFDIWSYRAWN